MKMLCVQCAEFHDDRMQRPFFVNPFVKLWLANGNFLFLIFISYNQQDATFLDLFISTDAVHVSGGSSA
jgi:hypothetical protein